MNQVKPDRIGTRNDCAVKPTPDRLRHPHYLNANHQCISNTNGYGAKELKIYLGINLWAFERERRHVRHKTILTRIIRIVISFELAWLCWCIYNAN